MTRKAAREIAVRLCFAINENGSEPESFMRDVFDEEYYETLASEDELYESYPDEKELQYISEIVNGVFSHQQEILAYIEKYATGWKLERISKTALAILSTAIYEVLYMPDVPDSAAINEAVELAKKYEEPETVPFVNGVLGGFSRTEAAED